MTYLYRPVTRSGNLTPTLAFLHSKISCCNSLNKDLFERYRIVHKGVSWIVDHYLVYNAKSNNTYIKSNSNPPYINFNATDSPMVNVHQTA